MKIPYDIIEKSFSSEASFEELIELEHWRSESKVNDTLYLQLKEQSEFAQRENLQFIIPDKEKLWNKIAHETGIVPKTKKLYSLKAVTGIACVVALVFLIGGYALSYIKSADKEQLVYTTITAPDGEKAKALLPDGTEVWLNSGSTLTYSNKFATDNRTIEMEGEAFFNVAKTAVPFQLSISENITLTVLGTSFNIKSRFGDNDIEVSLLEGKVKLNEKGSSSPIVTMNPMEKAIITKCGDQYVCDLSELTSYHDNVWTQSTLKFNGEGINDLVDKLQKWYNITIDYSELDLSKKYWMTISDETLEQTLLLIQKITPITYEIKNDKVTIKGL